MNVELSGRVYSGQYIHCTRGFYYIALEVDRASPEFGPCLTVSEPCNFRRFLCVFTWISDPKQPLSQNHWSKHGAILRITTLFDTEIPSAYCNKLVEVCFAESIYNNHCLAWRVLRLEIVLLKLIKESLNSWRALSNG